MDVDVEATALSKEVLNPIRRHLFPINKNSTPLICPLGVTGFEYKRIAEGTGEIETSSQFSNQKMQMQLKEFAKLFEELIRNEFEQWESENMLLTCGRPNTAPSVVVVVGGGYCVLFFGALTNELLNLLGVDNAKSDQQHHKQALKLLQGPKELFLALENESTFCFQYMKIELKL
ncbi:hypothetical protein QVD17_25610 [Tagetes erecta]|uniref:Uncharacterized protein n=1 Tax=Tagetes erecta TaxID=13708 RepID=A0AAD8KMV4_TARER|nr:hypothetical protein QVD17_25610 [Tagetes erecta]